MQQKATPKKEKKTPRQSKTSRQKAFLKAYRKTGNVTCAADAAKIDRASHYRWLEEPDYKAQFGDAADEAADRLEEEARRRAVDGVDEPVGWYQGKPGGTVKRYSDTLLIFLLKGVRPEKYRERFEHTGKDGGPIETKSDLSKLNPEQLRQLLAWLEPDERTS